MDKKEWKGGGREREGERGKEGGGWGTIPLRPPAYPAVSRRVEVSRLLMETDVHSYSRHDYRAMGGQASLSSPQARPIYISYC